MEPPHRLASVFPCPASLNGGQQRAAVPNVPDIPDIPAVPENAPINPGPAIAAFHPPANAALPDELFQLPPDIRPNPYNFRNRDIN